MPSKYGNQKTIIAGIAFDSRAEGMRYLVLKSWLDEGKITDLELQPVFILLPDYERLGKPVKRMLYYADFSYTETATGRRVTEDVKGHRTAIFNLKMKLLLYYYRDMDFRL